MAISRVEKMPLAQAERRPSAMSIIASAALDGKMNAETLSLLSKMANEERQEEAKREFDTALSALQAELPVVVKTVSGAKDNIKYSPIEHIIQICGPFISRHGFSFTFGEDVASAPDRKRATITVTHISGHSRQSWSEARIDMRNVVANAPQQDLGAIKYAQRAAIVAAFGISVAGVDKPNQGALSRSSHVADMENMRFERKQLADTQQPDPPPAEEAAPPPPTVMTHTDAKAALWSLIGAQLNKEQAADVSWGTREKWMKGKGLIDPDREFKAKDYTVAQLQDILKNAKGKI